MFDYKPRTFSAKQYAMLSHAAEITVREMEREQVSPSQPALASCRAQPMQLGPYSGLEASWLSSLASAGCHCAGFASAAGEAQQRHRPPSRAPAAGYGRLPGCAAVQLLLGFG